MPTFRFSQDPVSVAASREFIRAALRGHSPELIDRVVLVSSELVTNAIRHTSHGGCLDIEEENRMLRLEVSDGSYREPVERNGGDLAPDGRGLHIVGAIADHWGVDVNPQGKTVWANFEDS